MIAKIIEFSVRNRWLVIAVWAGIAIWGVYALLRTPVDAIPDLSENQVIVLADWMGRSPQDIEEQVTFPLSVQLQGMPHVKAVRSSSEANFSMLNIIFDEGRDLWKARKDVSERLATVTGLPEGVKPQLAPDATALGQIFWYTVEGDGRSLDELRALHDFNIKYQLTGVAGVAEVASVGGFVREYQVDVDPAHLRVYNLPLSAVYSALASSNMSVGGKVVVVNNAEYALRGIGWLTGLNDLENVVVESRGGVPIRVKDVASVQLGPEFRRSALEKNGREVTGGVVMMRYGENPLEVTRAIKERIRQIQAGLPQGVRIVPFYDRTRLIESAIHTVTGTLWEEMIIASIAILLILTHFRSALVVCVTLPMAVLVSFLFMYYLDIPSNIMSLCGIAISIGILVDAAVVMVENATHELHQHYGNGEGDAPPLSPSPGTPGEGRGGGSDAAAANHPHPNPPPEYQGRGQETAGKVVVHGDTTEIVVHACRLVGRPIFFSVVIMLLSFLPVFALGGQEGKLSHPLAFTKSFAMVGVAVMAITLVPALIPLLIKGRLRGEEENWIVRSFIHIYKPLLSWVIDRPGFVWWIMAVILCTGVGFVGSPLVSAIALAAGIIFVVLGVRKTGWTIWLLVAVMVFSFIALARLPDMLDLPGFRVRFSHSILSFDRTRWVVGLRWLPVMLRCAVGFSLAAALLVGLLWAQWRTVALASLLAVAFIADTRFRKLGSEFRPELDEGSLMDMPTTSPRVSMAEAVDDVMVRDRLMRTFPEVESVVGKIGRADTATDPSPLDMVETVVMMRPTAWWPKRKIEFDDMLAQAAVVGAKMQDRGWIKPDGITPAQWDRVRSAVKDADYLNHNPSLTAASSLLNSATQISIEKFDRAMRDLARRRQIEYEPELAGKLVEVAYDALLDHAGSLPARDGQRALLRRPDDGERAQILAAAGKHGGLLVESPRQEEVDALLATLRADLVNRRALVQRDDLLLDAPNPLRQAVDAARKALGAQPPAFAERVRDAIERTRDELWRERTKTLNWELADQAPAMINALLIDAFLRTAEKTPQAGATPASEAIGQLREELRKPLATALLLWPKTKGDIKDEMNSELQMPGWGNSWTQPIKNRVDMLATGVRTDIGVKVFGPTGKPLDAALADIQRVSEEIRAKLKNIPGASEPFADQVTGKRYLEIHIERDKADRYGVNMADIGQAIETAIGGSRVTTTVEGRQRFPVRLRYARDYWQDIDAIKNVLVTGRTTSATLLAMNSTSSPQLLKPQAGASGMGGGMGSGAGGMGGGAAAPKPSGGGTGGGMAGGGEQTAPVAGPVSSGMVQIPLFMVADIRVAEGPSMVKSENGRLRSYVTLNVRGRDIVGFVEEAQQAIRPIEAKLAGTGMSIEWTGEFEHQVRARRTLSLVFPMVIALILFLLYVTFKDMLEVLLVLLAVAGALAGAIMFQAAFGFNFSVIVSIGYVAAFGMATETGVIMLVYLREAIDKRGGLAGIATLAELRQAVIEGAVHRLRPKLLTEGVAIVGLVPMLWASGTGAEIMRPMAAPVLGGLLISDEVIDLMIPVLFYWIRRWRWKKIHAAEEAAIPVAAVAGMAL